MSTTPIQSASLVDGKPTDSKPIELARPVEQPRSANGSMAPAGAALFIIGGLFWLAGAKYTLLGWVTGLNWFLAWLELPARVPAPRGWAMLLQIPVGLLYSAVEVKRPWKYRNKNPEKVALYWAIWGALVASDIGTTFLGVRNPGAGAWQLTHR